MVFKSIFHNETSENTYLVYDEEKSIYDSIDKTQGDLHERENNLRL